MVNQLLNMMLPSFWYKYHWRNLSLVEKAVVQVFSVVTSCKQSVLALSWELARGICWTASGPAPGEGRTFWVPLNPVKLQGSCGPMVDSNPNVSHWCALVTKVNYLLSSMIRSKPGDQGGLIPFTRPLFDHIWNTTSRFEPPWWRNMFTSVTKSSREPWRWWDLREWWVRIILLPN